MKYHFCISPLWESGQDVSSRFGPQQTGGTIIQHVRPVDLQASMAQGATILSRWAEMLSPTHTDPTLPNPYPAEMSFWHEIANEFTVKTRLMWRDGWFHDYDSVAGVWSSEHDAMHLAPIFCDAAGWGQIEQLRPTLAEPPHHSSQWAPLSWPPVVMTLIGATAAAQMPQEAAELAFRFIDASYRSTDSRELDEYGGLPGVTREYRRALSRSKWGEIDYQNAGIEGYGWGALSVHLLIQHVMGLSARDLDKIAIAPSLPQALRRPGATYKIAPIPWNTYLLSIECLVKSANSYEAILQCHPRPQKDALAGEANLAAAGEFHKRWEGTWGEEHIFRLPDLTVETGE